MNPTAPLELIMDVLESRARREILKHFRADSCIASTRVVCRVLNSFGYHAVPYATQTFIYNEAYMRAFNANPLFSLSSSEDWRAWYAKHQGAWSIGLGMPDRKKPRPDGVNAHIVAVLEKEKLMIDASLDQATRVEKKIFLPGVLVGDFEQWDAEHPLVYEFNGLAIQYRIIKNDEFRMSQDWSDKSRTKRAVNVLTEEIEKDAQNGHERAPSRSNRA